MKRNGDIYSLTRSRAEGSIYRERPGLYMPEGQHARSGPMEQIVWVMASLGIVGVLFFLGIPG